MHTYAYKCNSQQATTNNSSLSPSDEYPSRIVCLCVCIPSSEAREGTWLCGQRVKVNPYIYISADNPQAFISDYCKNPIVKTHIQCTAKPSSALANSVPNRPASNVSLLPTSSYLLLEHIDLSPALTWLGLANNATEYCTLHISEHK